MAGIRRDGSLRTPRIVWVVRVDDAIYTALGERPGRGMVSRLQTLTTVGSSRQ